MEPSFHLDATTAENDEALPFAITTATAELRLPQHISADRPMSSSAPITPGYYGYSSEYSSNSNPLPQLESSLLSSPTDEGESFSSTPGSEFASSCLLQPDSQYLDAAASLLQPTSSLLGASAAGAWAHDSSSAPLPTEQSVAFSQLLDAADDRQQQKGELPPQTQQPACPQRLPVLPEEASVASSASIFASSFFQPDAPIATLPPRWDTRSQNDWSRMNPFMSQSQQTILQAAESVHRTQDRRLAALAGATATRTGDTSFSVKVDLAGSCSVRDVMDIVGNPDLLRLWCDPVRALVITKSSEGARNAANLHGPSEEGREYEGEWIEASTTQLVEPVRTSCVYATGRAVSTAVGFPSYGKIVMFVERQRGQVGLTIGRFSGGIEISHKLRIFETPEGKVRIVDDVRLQRHDRSEPRFCGFRDAVERIFLPTLDDYLDQVLSSMARLRYLVENGENSIQMDMLPESAYGAPNAPLLRA